MKVPAEDHEWEDLGHAWPTATGMHRDAILQPPKPEESGPRPLSWRQRGSEVPIVRPVADSEKGARC